MIETLNASIALKNGTEIEFEIDVDYSQHKEWDDFQTWCETELNGADIESLTVNEAKEILANEIDCIFIEDLFGHDSDVDYIFGSMEEFLKIVKEISEEA